MDKKTKVTKTQETKTVTKLKVKTPKTYIKKFFANCILKNNSVKTAFYITVKNLRVGCKE